MKATQKNIKAALANCFGWNFGYRWKENRRIVLFRQSSAERIIEALAAADITYISVSIPESLRTGHIQF